MTFRNQILVGDCIERMRELPAGSVHCCITSPPYWGLRDYGIPPRVWSDGESCAYGSEQSPESFVRHSVEVFADVKRVLRDDGTLWLNFGDSYATGAGSAKNPGSRAKPRSGHEGKHGYVNDYPTSQPNRMPLAGLKVGDLCNIPHRVAAALQADGWYWRSTIVWAKKSPMPESVSGWRWVKCGKKVRVANRGGEGYRVGANGHKPQQDHDGKDFAQPTEFIPCPGCKKCEANGGLVLRRGRWRPTTGHEYIFMFSKSESYFCDGDAMQEATTGNAHSRGNGLNPKAKATDAGDHLGPRAKQNDSFSAACSKVVLTRNPRSVWSISSEPFKGAHFATFPSEIPLKCITAGTSAGGCCDKCGSPFAPVVSSDRIATRPGTNSKVGRVSDDPDSPYERQSGAVVGNRDPQRHVAISSVSGYLPTCKCGAEIGRSVVLDPFGGSGTTAQAARHLGRDWVICEINPSYVELAEKRIATPIKVKAKKKAKVSPPVHNQQVLFE